MFCQALQQGLQNALNALKGNRCANFYGGQGPQTLDATQYRFLNMHDPNTGAATISPNNVFVNSKGPYMTYTPTPGQTGPFGRYWTQGQFRGFILLHEPGHQLSPIMEIRISGRVVQPEQHTEFRPAGRFELRQYGQITATPDNPSDARELQYALKFYW